MKRHVLWLAFAVVCGLAMIISGCSSGDISVASSYLSKVSVGADIGAPGGAGLTKSDGVLIVAPLPGAKVEAIDFRTGAVVATGTIGSDGLVDLNLPAGITVAVVITGSKDGKDYRLSLIIPVVPNVDDQTPYIATIESTITAEALAQSHFGKAIDEATLAAVQQKTQEFLADPANANVDISLGGGLLNSGSTFGGASALDSTVLATVIAEAAKTVDGNLTLAKNAVYQINTIDLPLYPVLNQEMPDLFATYASFSNALESIDVGAVAEKYSALGDRLGDLIIPALTDDLYYNSEFVSITDLQIGKGYSIGMLPVSISPLRNAGLLVEDDANFDTAGQITLAMGSTRLVAKKVGAEWQITQTDLVDTALEYKVKFQQSALVLEPFPAFSGTISLKDAAIETPVVFQGAVGMTPMVVQQVMRLSFNGTLTSEEVKVSGNAVIDFELEPFLTAASSKVKGLPRVYLPTPPKSVTITNGKITITLDGKTAEVSSSLIIIKTTSVTLQDGNYQYQEVVPTEISLTNGKIAITLSDGSLASIGTLRTPSLEVYSVEITGSAYLKATAAADGDRVNWNPTNISLSNASAKVVTSEGTMQLSGSFVGTATVKEGRLLPTYAKLTGAYSNTHTKLTIDGTVEANCSNTSPLDSPAEFKGRVAVKGSMKSNGKVVYALDIVVTGNGAGVFNAAINKIQWGGCWLTGAGSLTVPLDKAPAPVATLTLTNQAGVVFKLEAAAAGDDLTGSITVGGEKVADLIQDEFAPVLLVKYIDGTEGILAFGLVSR